MMEKVVELFVTGVLKVGEIKMVIGLTRMEIGSEMINPVTTVPISTEKLVKLPKDVIDALAEEVRLAQIEANTVGMMVKTSMDRCRNLDSAPMEALSNRADRVEIEPLAEMDFKFGLMMDLLMAIKTVSMIKNMGALTVEQE